VNHGESDDSKGDDQLRSMSDEDSDQTEDYEQPGSSCAEVPSFNLLPGQGYRSGKSRSNGLASLVRGATFEVMKDLSPKCEKRTPEELEVWRRSFRGKISPGVPGVDAEQLVEIKRSVLDLLNEKGSRSSRSIMVEKSSSRM
jgi:hypothetical protein